MRYVLCATLCLVSTATGWADDATTQPAAQGTRAIAAWDVVPYQRFDKPFKAGVVAFHETGVKVEFTARSALDLSRRLLAETVGGPTLNPRTNVWEYWIELDPNALPPGLLLLRATAIPLGTGHKAVGMDLALYVDRPARQGEKAMPDLGKTVWVDAKAGDDASGDGTKGRPFKTLTAGVRKAGDGGTIYLMPGDYSAQALRGGLKRKYWTIITPAPGVKREQVQIGPGRTGTEKLCFRNVTLFADPPTRKYNTILAGENGRTVVWCDNCKFYNRKGRWGGGGNHFGNRYRAYVTGGITTEMDNGPGAILLRNHKIFKITSDALTGARTAINCEVRDIDPGTTGAHPDWHQSYTGGKGKYKTCIIYNCSGFDCQSQGFFGHYLKDSAFVNCIFEKVPGHALSQYSGHMDHVLWLHCMVPNQSWLWRGTLRGANCYVLNGVFAGMHEAQGGDAGGFTIDRNHFINPKRAMGTNATTGDAVFVDPNSNDYRLRPDSPAAGTGMHLQCVPADINGKPYDKGKRNRGCYAGTSPAPAASANPKRKE